MIEELHSILELQLDDSELLEKLYLSILPEVRSPPSYKSKVKISIDNKSKTITLNVCSKTLSSLRAAINSYLRLIYVILSSEDILSTS